jgi:hypothetical protein
MINGMIGTKVLSVPLSVYEYDVISYALRKHLEDVKFELQIFSYETEQAKVARQAKVDRIETIETILRTVNNFDLNQ